MCFNTASAPYFSGSGQLATCLSPTKIQGFAESKLKRGDQMPELKVQVNAKGPLLIKGGATVVHEDGTEEKKAGTIALCRCELSEKKPFCAGAHRNCTTL
jgi:hypothetical protein